MKKAILSIILFCLSFAGFSQRQVLIQSGDKGLNVRISNAAANVLDVTDTEMFIVRVNY